MSSENPIVEQKKDAIKLKIIKITIIIVACVILSMIAAIGLILSIFMGSLDSLCTTRTLKTSTEIMDPSIYQENFITCIRKVFSKFILWKLVKY